MPAKYIRNIVVFAIIFVVLGEFLSRKRYAEPFINPPKEVTAIQDLLVLDDDLGFHWRENISPSEGIRLTEQDSETWPLSTDANGFINPPQVIEKRQQGEPVQVVGLGDSFMEHAAYYITDFFSERGLNYYNLAIHRQSPPQYLDILRTYAQPLRPEIVLLGITETDLDEINDYLNWRESGLDWFTFHSGTWCGRPVQSSPILRARDRYFPGYTALFSLVEDRAPGLAKFTPSIHPSDARGGASTVEFWLDEINQETTRNDQLLVVLMIPTRDSVLAQTTPEHTAFSSIMQYCSDQNIPYLDLHAVFRNHENPLSLYYAVNGHWNGNGINIAMNELVKENPEI